MEFGNAIDRFLEHRPSSVMEAKPVDIPLAANVAITESEPVDSSVIKVDTPVAVEANRVNLNVYKTVEERQKCHEIPIKKEYLKEVYADQRQSQQERPKESAPPPKKKGRFSKAGKKEFKENRASTLFEGVGICFTTVKGLKCTKEGCKRSHNIEGFVAQTEKDIGDVCVNFQKKGFCPYGFACRFAQSHIKDGKLVVDEEKKSKFEADGETMNIVTKEVQTGLRKRKIPFLRTRAALKAHANGDLGVITKTKLTEEQSNIVLPPREKKMIDFTDKLILAPLTTIGNLPFRRICKSYGVDVTVGEMALATQLLNGNPAEWALVKRHPSEDIFGVQLAGSHANTLTAVAELLCDNMNIDFIDINCGCPIDLICNKGAGSSLLGRKNRLESICKSMVDVMDIPLTIKIRNGIYDNHPTAHTYVHSVKEWGVSAITLHGRSKEQRYTKVADWEYTKKCSDLSLVPFITNGDIFSWQEAVALKEDNNSKSLMIARGAIIKPWLFKEIKEEKDFDISGSERMDMIKEFIDFGLEHWGSDDKGIENVRYFFLNWMSFLHRYVPVGIVEYLPVKINHRPPEFIGRDDRETLLASPLASDWIKISEMFLGPVPESFSFQPKHRANSYRY